MKNLKPFLSFAFLFLAAETGVLAGADSLYFQMAKPASTYYFFHFLDRDGDGLTDLLGFNYAANGYIDFFKNTGTGFELASNLTTPGWPYPSEPIPRNKHYNQPVKYLADLNADGIADILVWGANHFNCGNNSVRIYWGENSGYFEETNFTTLNIGSSPCVGAFLVDIDSDGDLDVYTRSTSNNRVFLNDGNGNFQQTSTFWTGRDIEMIFDDYDGDGIKDLVYTQNGWANGQWGIRFNKGLGNGDFDPATKIYYAPQRPHDVFINFQANPLNDAIPNVLFNCTLDGSNGGLFYIGQWNAALGEFEFNTISSGNHFNTRLLQTIDYNQDGFEDIIYSYTSSAQAPFQYTLMCRLNDGYGHFDEELTLLSGVAYEPVSLFNDVDCSIMLYAQDPDSLYIFHMMLPQGPCNDWQNIDCETGVVHTVAILDDLASSIDGQPLAPGDLVGFFHLDQAGSPVCNQFAEWQGTIVSLDLCGDDPSTPDEKEGFAIGEDLMVKVKKDGVDWDLIACYLPNDHFGLNNPNATASFLFFGLSYIECLKTVPPPGTGLDCDDPIPISCGETIVNTNANGVSSANVYNCFPNLVDGPELIFAFENPVSQNVLITMTGLQADLELLLLNPCDRNQCLAFSDRTGSSSEAIFMENLAPGTYYIVVEGYLGSTSSFSLQVECGVPSNGDLNCPGAVSLVCGQPISTSNATGSDEIVQYSCSGSYASGKERVFTFTTPTPKVVQVKVTNLSADLDLFLLSECDPQTCLTYSAKSGTENEAVIWTAIPGKVYYLVVDGYFGQTGNFTISATCFDPCADPADCPYELDCSNATPIECNIPISGNNGTGLANADAYSCPNAFATGQEVVFLFENPITQDVSIILSGLSQNLDIFLLNHCSVFSCMASSLKSGVSNEGLAIQALPAGTYYIVVDGYNGAVSNFNLLVSCASTTLDCHQIDLVTGANFISSDVIPLNPDIGALFPYDPLSPIVVIENQYNQSYSPSFGSNPALFGDWDFRKAYRFKTLSPVSIEFCGLPADPETPIPYMAETLQGLPVNNWTAFLKGQPYAVGDLFNAAATPDIFRVWNMPTSATGILTPQSFLPLIPAGLNFTMQSGRGYILNAAEDGEFSYGLFSSPAQTRGWEEYPVFVDNGCEFFKTPLESSLYSASLLISKQVLEPHFSKGDEIGVFDAGNRLFAAGKYDGHSLSLVVPGDDPGTERLEGFLEGEPMLFRWWERAKQRLHTLQMMLESGTGEFENGATYYAAGMEVEETASLHETDDAPFWSVFPNPARETITIEILHGTLEFISLDILSLEGRNTLSITDAPGLSNISVSHLPRGAYFVRLTSLRGVSAKKLILAR